MLIPLSPDAPFYVAGGTLPPDVASYVPRDADEQLYQALRAGDTCYVLNARQMGKSSLCVRALGRLRADGVRTAFLDLTKFGGRNLTAEQWYAALLSELGRELGLRAELLAYWRAHAELPPVQRLFGALTEAALPALAAPIVLFIDEIDVTRSLPFDTDEFFAAVRQCCVGRATDPALGRLAFCLLGTATPSDLVRDTRLSPFNVGRRVEVRDFTTAEAAPLASGLGPDGAALLRRVLYWTGGHPYLTQRLCREAASAGAKRPADIDRHCLALFRTRTAREADDNLALVANRLLKSEVELAGLLSLYGLVLADRSVPDDERDPLCSVLKLSGVVKVERGVLRVRNRIYGAVFDRRWVAEHMPGAELRRVRQAYRRGLARAFSAAALVVLVMAGLVVYAGREAVRARGAETGARSEGLLKDAAIRRGDREANARRAALNAAVLERKRADLQAGRAREKEATARQAAYLARKNAAEAVRQARLAATSARRAEREKGYADLAAMRARRAEGLAKRRESEAQAALYGANMGLIQRDWEAGQLHWVAALVEETRAYAGRGWEWGYWQRLLPVEMVDFRGHRSAVFSVAFSPDGKRVLTGSWDSTARLWDAPTGRELLSLKGHKNWVVSVAFSPDGKRVLTGSLDKTARLWDGATGRELLVLEGHTSWVHSVAFSTEGKRVLTGSADKTARLWDAATGRELRPLIQHTDNVSSVAFSLDGKRVLTGSWDKSARLSGAATGRELLPLNGHTDDLSSVAFSPDGKRVLTGSHDNTARLWDAATGRELMALQGTSWVLSVAFSADGKRFLTGSYGNTARLWCAATGRELLPLTGHTDRVPSVAFSPDAKRVLTGSWDNTARLWDAATGRELLPPTGHTDNVSSVAFSPDGRRFLTGSYDNTARLWDAATGRRLLALQGHKDAITSVAISLDGKRVLTGSHDDTARLWDAATGRELLTLKGHTDNVSSVAFSPDGKRVLTGSYDKTARLWDAATGRELLALKGRTNVISSVGFSPDGKRVLTGSSDGTAIIWFSDERDWPAATRRRESAAR